MPASLLVATILTVGWNLTLLVLALVTESGPFEPEKRERLPMHKTIQTVSAEVGKPEYDVRVSAWKRDSGNGGVGDVRSRVMDTPLRVEVAVPYANASVTVVHNDEEEARFCSVCMN